MWEKVSDHLIRVGLGLLLLSIIGLFIVVLIFVVGSIWGAGGVQALLFAPLAWVVSYAVGGVMLHSIRKS